MQKGKEWPRVKIEPALHEQLLNVVHWENSDMQTLVNKMLSDQLAWKQTLRGVHYHQRPEKADPPQEPGQ